MTERVLNLVTYIEREIPQVIEYDKIFNGLKALSEVLSIYSYIINYYVSHIRLLAGTYILLYDQSTIEQRNCIETAY